LFCAAVAQLLWHSTAAPFMHVFTNTIAAAACCCKPIKDETMHIAVLVRRVAFNAMMADV
jgi:hypothetical protein